MFTRSLYFHSKKFIAASLIGGITLASIQKKHVSQFKTFLSPLMLLIPQKLAWCQPVGEEVKRVYIGLSLRSMMD